MPNVFEQVAGKAAGAIAGAKATLDGLDGVFIRLVSEHREATALIERITDTENLDKREELWSELSVALLSHEGGEVQEVYSAFEAYPALQGIVNEHNEHAERLEVLIAQLDVHAIDAPEWATLFRQLEAAVQRHVEKEEIHFFQRAQAVIGRHAAESLEQPYISSKEKLAQALLSGPSRPNA